MNGKLSQKSILSLSLTRKQSVLIEILLLILTGVFIATLRAYLRVPLNIPGRHGIEVMGILMAARMISGQSFASSITMIASGAMMFLPFMGFKEERDVLNAWSKKQGKEKINSYWEEKNTKSIDGFETKILED